MFNFSVLDQKQIKKRGKRKKKNWPISGKVNEGDEIKTNCDLFLKNLIDDDGN